MARNLPQTQVVMLFNGGTLSQTLKVYSPSLNPQQDHQKSQREMEEGEGTGSSRTCSVFLINLLLNSVYIYPRGKKTIIPLGHLRVSKGSEGHICPFQPISLIIINALQFPLSSIIPNTNNLYPVTL